MPRASTAASPPWQSVQPSTTPGFWCIVWRSVAVWQLVQPADLRSASATDCDPGAGAASAPHAPIATMSAVAGARIVRVMSERRDQVDEDRVLRAALPLVVE